MKARMGATHFLTKTLPKVAAEMALSVLAYNLNTGHEHCRGQTPDRCDRGLRHTRVLAASANIPEAVLTRPRPGTDICSNAGDGTAVHRSAPGAVRHDVAHQ